MVGRGVVATDGTPADQLIHEAKQLPSMAGQELASRVSCAKQYMWNAGSIDLATSPWAEQMGEARRTGSHLQQAALWLGASLALLPFFGAWRERDLGAARARLGEPRATTAFDEGRAMTWDQAIELALGKKSDTSPARSVPLRRRPTRASASWQC